MSLYLVFKLSTLLVLLWIREELPGRVLRIHLDVSSTQRQIVRPGLIFCNSINHRDGIAARDAVV